MPQPRSQAEIKWAIDEWLKCTTLDEFERTLITEMRGGIEESMDRFNRLRSVFCNMFEPQLMSAMKKANDEGRCLKWP